MNRSILKHVIMPSTLAVFIHCCPAAEAETVTLNSNEMHKASEHVSFGIRFFGLTYLSFENPSEKNGNNIEGYKQISVWDKGKLVTINVSDEDWQETRVRTTNGCEVGRRLSKAKFTYEVKPQAQPAESKPIEGTDVKLVSVVRYEAPKRK
ncbi:MAG: hypothetical protein C0469_02750 [Cyanobacteria bacterium DS2.3.42]|nr:hypothetical protein [Cyanobacteria bacterium DS2.3.42]